MLGKKLWSRCPSLLQLFHYLGGHFGNTILSPRMWALSAYADPKPTPAPKATADHRVVGLRNMTRAEANPANDPYTNRRSVKSMHKSYCSSICIPAIRFFAMSVLSSLKLRGPSALHSSWDTTTLTISGLRLPSKFDVTKFRFPANSRHQVLLEWISEWCQWELRRRQEMSVVQPLKALWCPGGIFGVYLHRRYLRLRR